MLLAQLCPLLRPPMQVVGLKAWIRLGHQETLPGRHIEVPSHAFTLKRVASQHQRTGAGCGTAVMSCVRDSVHVDIGVMIRQSL